MRATHPKERLRSARKDIRRYRDDVEDWKLDYEELQRDCWACEDLIGMANFVFSRILAFDTDIRESVFAGRIAVDDEQSISQDLLGIMREWHTVSLEVLPDVERVEGIYKKVDGAEEFRRNIESARGILTSDDEFFQGDALAQLRDEAIEAHRAGQTKGLVNNAATHP